MIYRLTEAEEEQVSIFYKKMYDLEKRSDLNGLIIAKNEFNTWISKIEIERYKDLKSPENILESAKGIINDAILFEYVSILTDFEKDISQSKELPIIYEIVNGNTLCENYFDFAGWYFKHKSFNAALKNKIEIPVINIKKGALREVIKSKAIYKHIELLEGSQEAKALERLLDDILSKSILVCQDKKIYRTVAKAKGKGAITKGPDNLVIPTLPNYQYSMSLYPDKNAYLQQINSMDNLVFKDGALYFKGPGAKTVTEAELRDLRTNEGIEEIDLISLRYYYSILFQQYQVSKVLQDIIVISVPVLAGRKDPKEEDAKRVVEKIKSYHNVMGVIKGERNGKIRESYYQVLNFEYYDEKNNIVAFSSPYMNYVIQTIDEAAARIYPDNKKNLKKSGEVLKLPSYSFLVKSDIEKERNKLAAENVILIVQGIEVAGKKGYHFSIKTLIERNIFLSKRLKENPSRKAQILKRTFIKTWELLRTQTRLEEYYKNIQLPDPKDPACIPTAKNMDNLVIDIKHDGKIRKSKKKAKQ